MRLALSSDALPSHTPDQLARACAARGLAGLEIVLDDLPTVEQVHRWRSLQVPVLALRTEKCEMASSSELATLAGILEVPVVTPPGLVPSTRAAELAAVYGTAGSTLLLGVRTWPDEVESAVTLVERVGADSLGLAWEIRPLDEDLAEVPRVWSEGTPHILHVRLFGGGPEQREQDGRGIGPLFVELALGRYSGTVAITPSDPARQALWERWSRAVGPSGCGSRARQLPDAVEGRLELDVRRVEPKDRIDTVLGAYGEIGTGGTLHLVVDHDPDCMRHLLTATQPPGSFTFEYRERGPNVWRVDVVRRRVESTR